MDVCYVEQNDTQLDLYSHISDLVVHPAPNEWDPKHVYSFPLTGDGMSSRSAPSYPAVGPYLCTQGCCGALTHFTPGTFHALDFRCPLGTNYHTLSIY